MTFGYLRSEILGALVSILVLWVLLCVIVFHAVFRLINPPKIQTTYMMIVAVLGIICNLIMALTLHGGHGHDHSHGHGDHDHDSEPDHIHSHVEEQNMRRNCVSKQRPSE